ncbi:TPA: hypothetical protein ME558_004813 [Klebsiella pneumoniae]|uniref:hypothetical protein n=1 Tax=Klebsiella pneumoniae TaxID=573 RepID=UPI001F4A1A3C|nr:hypothetical protein [Klebsiella pneumoniae]HEM8797743.1 hypothetical protein [Klebsiella michiganensis]EKX2446416.1 hypothetical protein [Klebsiella pneumoniae]EKX8270858.1 hypothetical protein [Klebsiella pneumoniae]EKX9363749.1 hypothetical protein [Klebsiella pneumoniae]
MARRNSTEIEINGDSSGLVAAISQAEKKLGTFGKNVGGGIGDASNAMSSGIGKMTSGLTGLISISGLAATALGGLVLKLNDTVRELNQLSKQSGISVSDLQKLEKAFRITGLGADKMADINQDALDKMADAYRNGGGIADDMLSVGLDPKKFTKLLNDPNGGIKAVIQAFYELRAAGGSNADQKFFLESLASDASRLTGVLNDSANAQEAWNKIQAQSISVTDEQAAQFATFDQNLSSLTDTGKTYLYDLLTPLVTSTNNLADAMRNVNSTNFLVDILQTATDLQIKINEITHMFPGLSTVMGLMSDGAEQFRQDTGPQMPKLNNTLPTQTATVTLDPNDGWKNKEQEAAKAAAAAAKARAAANKAAAAEKKLVEDRLKAQKELNAISSDATIGTSERQLAVFDRQQQDITDKIKKNAEVLKLSQKELDGYLDKQSKYAAYQREQMINGMIGYSDPNQQLKTNIGLLQSGSLNDQQKGFLANQQAESVGSDTTQAKLAANQQEMQLQLQQNDLLLQGHEDYEKRKAEITAKYAAQAVQIQREKTTQQLQSLEESFGTIGQGMADAFGKSTGAAQAAFAVQRGLSISTTIMSIQEALAKALALGFPQNIPAYAQIAAMGMSIISTAKGASSGQFHGGIDNLPSSYDNKSFMLKAGERVVQPEANKKLTNFLDNQEKGSTISESNISAPMNVYYSGTNDREFQAQLKKHQNSIVQAVKDSQRRNS